MKSWKSRKFIVFAASVVLYGLNLILGGVVEESTLSQMIALVIGWMVAQGIADAGLSSANDLAREVVDDVADAVEAVRQVLMEDSEGEGDGEEPEPTD